MHWLSRRAGLCTGNPWCTGSGTQFESQPKYNLYRDDSSSTRHMTRIRWFDILTKPMMQCYLILASTLIRPALV